MFSTMLVNASDLVRWADRRDAQDTLPRVIRWLVHAAPVSFGSVRFPAGEAVHHAGWDGTVNADESTPFIPEGISVWEMGVSRSPKQKADQDYETRRSNPRGIAPSSTTYVFVTPRRWQGKEQWKRERRAEGFWKDVWAFDADDLESWLESVPAVHLRLSIRLGKHPKEAVDIGTYWQNWLQTTDPPIGPELVLAGRQETAKRIADWLLSPDQPLMIRAETRAEAVAVFVATLHMQPPTDRERILAHAVLVRDEIAWDQLSTANSHHCLIADFAPRSESIAQALRNKHAVAIPLGHSEQGSDNAVLIPRIDPDQMVQILVDGEIDQERAEFLASFARRSLTVLRRKIAIVPDIETPKWALPENARALVPALLLGRWSGATEGDRRALATLACSTYEDSISTLTRWSNEDDPPIQCVGNIWYLTSEEDAWSLLRRYVNLDDVVRFQKLAVDVLAIPDSTIDLSDSDRLIAGFRGFKPTYSKILRKGIANTLAIMGARGGSLRITGEENLEFCAKRPVADLLATDDWKVWASLPLRLLAEAAPKQFLDAVERGVSGDNTFLRQLFREDHSSMLSAGMHTDLLFALETVAWSSEHLNQAARVLAQLAKIDPGGKLSNRPASSLRYIFLPWLPQTCGSLDMRLRAIDSVRDIAPDVAWKLMNSMLPDATRSSHPSPRPVWRDWAPTGRIRIPLNELAQNTDAIVHRMLIDVGSNGHKWADLIAALTRLTEAEYSDVMSKLEALDRDTLLPIDSAAINEAIRNVLWRQRSFPEAGVTLPEVEISRLELALSRFNPADPLHRYGWLFGHDPKLPEGRYEKWEQYQHLLAKRRGEAVAELLGQHHLSWIQQFVEGCARADIVGITLADVGLDEESVDAILGAHLSDAQIPMRECLCGLVRSKIRADGSQWAKTKLAASSGWSATEKAAFCEFLPFGPFTWKLVDELPDASKVQYWKRIRPFHMEAQDVEAGARRLLENDRPEVAAYHLFSHLRETQPSASLVADTLYALLNADWSEMDGVFLSADNITDLLTFVVESPSVERPRVAELEWALLPFIGRYGHQRATTLVGEMARDPRFFVKVVGIVYRAEGEPPKELTDEEMARWERASDLLDSWRSVPLPGNQEGDGQDYHKLAVWVHEASSELKTAGLLPAGYSVIGRILSNCPSGDDGAWPHPAVRHLVEVLCSSDFEEGLVIGRLNNTGMTWRSPFDGGEIERRTAQQYETYSKTVADQWPRCAAMLRNIRDHYEVRARDEDRTARIREDLGH